MDNAIWSVGFTFGIIGICFLIAFIVGWHSGPGKEIARVNAAPGDFAELAFDPAASRTYQLWARVHADCDSDDAEVAAELSVSCEGASLRAPIAITAFTIMYHVSSQTSVLDTSKCCFTVRLWKTPVLQAGRRVIFRARVTGVENTPVRAVQLFVSV